MPTELLPPPALRRSSRGLLLGVFRGFAEHRGWSVLLTRVVGVIVLLILAAILGAGGPAKWLVAGFFYLLAALLMPPPAGWFERRFSSCFLLVMPAPHPFNLPPFLRDLRRSRDGILLGVFRGSAEAKGWSVLWTRVIGTIALLGLSGAFTGDFGLSRLLLAAFFYLILAVILPLEEDRAGADDATLKGDFATPRRRSSWCDWTGSKKASPESEPFAVRRETSLRVPSRFGTEVPRGDLSELAARLERLSRRVQRIEGVVTGPEYDWERRLRS